VRRTGLAKWRAYDDDPQFVLAPKWIGAHYLLLEIANADRVIDPRIYIDHGMGFGGEEGEEIELLPTQYGIYAIALNSFEHVRRVRFDPSSYPSQFQFRAFAGFDEASVRSFIGRKLRQATKGASPTPSCETIAAPQSAKLAGLGPRPLKARNISHHYEQVIAIANGVYGRAGRRRSDKPLLSFVCPVFNTPVKYLDQLLESFPLQRRGAWELILCDDGSSSQETIDWLDCHSRAPSLRVLRSAVNAGIAAATSSALAVAKGEWVALIDHDDALTPFAVDRVIEAIEQNPGAEFIYTDEVVTDESLEPKSYFLKPAFDPVLLSGVNYINHLSIYRRDRLREIGGIRQGYEGSQDYDLLLRYLSDLPEDRILHLPYPAYLWRRDGKSYSARFIERATQNARLAIGEKYAVGDVPALVEGALDPNLHRIRFDKRERVWPTISVVIPSRDAFALISRRFDDLIRGTDYPNLEIIVVDNGSKDNKVLDLYKKMRASHPAFRADIVEAPFNFSKQINRGLRAARGEYILLLNNDVEIVDPGWLKEMLSCFDYPTTGIVGAKLLYPDGSLQHAGVIVGLGSVAGHWFCGMPGAHPGPMGRLNVRQSFAAVTGACMLISRKCVEAVGNFDEENFAIAYNDTDFCLRAGREGFRIVWTPFATLYHHESATRGSDETRENIERFNREKEALRKKYSLSDYIDPAYSPYYGRADSKPGFFVPAAMPSARIFRV